MTDSPLDQTQFRHAATTGVSLSGELPPGELVAAQNRVLGAIVVLGASMAVYHALFWTIWADQATTTGVIAAPATVAAYVLLGAWVWRAPLSRRGLVASAMVVHLVFAFALAVIEPYDLLPSERPFTLITWNCVNILLVPVLVPASTRVIVGFAVVLATVHAAGFLLLAGTPGVAAFSPSVYLSLFMPQYLTAVMAAVPSQMFATLRRDLSKMRQLGAYELVEKLGAGGMGEVWSANHRFLARPAAIKLIRSEALGSTAESRGRAVARFEREAQAIAQLESPHTVRLYDFGVADDGAFYYVMELLRGMDLRRVVTAHGPMPPERVVHILRQACASLTEAHDAGLVHRDIKPANLFLGPRAGEHDVVRVVDFGLVKQREEKPAADIDLTQEGRIQGTPSTLAPEAVTGGPIDARADLYALGCVAFYLLTGTARVRRQQRHGGGRCARLAGPGAAVGGGRRRGAAGARSPRARLPGEGPG